MNSKNEQNALVETHLYVVKWVIRWQIHWDESRVGLGFDDLFQEGCLWLCKAAATYNAELAGFETYAKRVVRNGLISYRRELCGKNRPAILSLEAPLDTGRDGGGIFIDELPGESELEVRISQIETLNFLESVKDGCTDTVRLGIEALEWLIKGYTVTEIAEIFGIKPNLVGARISRAVQVLRQDPRFAEIFFRPFVEKRAA